MDWETSVGVMDDLAAAVRARRRSTDVGVHERAGAGALAG
jgi:hypothetical protein